MFLDVLIYFFVLFGLELRIYINIKCFGYVFGAGWGSICPPYKGHLLKIKTDTGICHWHILSLFFSGMFGVLSLWLGIISRCYLQRLSPANINIFYLSVESLSEWIALGGKNKGQR